jgi:hypothetical protein
MTRLQMSPGKQEGRWSCTCKQRWQRAVFWHAHSRHNSGTHKEPPVIEATTAWAAKQLAHTILSHPSQRVICPSLDLRSHTAHIRCGYTTSRHFRQYLLPIKHWRHRTSPHLQQVSNEASHTFSHSHIDLAILPHLYEALRLENQGKMTLATLQVNLLF